MSIYELKPRFQNLLRPISDGLVEKGFTANQVTLSAIFLSGATAYVIAHPAKNRQQLWYVLPVALFSRMALNAIDGMMAKEHGQASQVGAVLNEVGDILSDSMLFASVSPHLQLANVKHGKHALSGLFIRQDHALIGLSLTTELTAIGGSALTGSRANQGPLGKSDRAFLLGVIGALAGANVLSKSALLPYAFRLYLLNNLLLIKTTINRSKYIANTLWQQQYQQQTQRLLAANTPFTQLNTALLNRTFDNNGIQNLPHKAKKLIKEKTDMEKDNNHSKSHASHHLNHKAANNIKEHIGSYNGYDETAMFYRYWLNKPLEDIQQNSQQEDDQNKEKIVIMLHRGHEHSARLTQMAHAYVQAGYQVFAWDARGNGRSGGERDHAESFAQLVRDLDDFVAVVKQLTLADTSQMLLIASSLGAVIASSWVHDYAPNIRGVILGTPAFAIRLYVPFAKPALKVAKKFGVMNRVSSYVKAKVLTHDQKAQQIYNDDPLISSSISRDLLVDSLDTGKRLLDDAGAFNLPMFILCAGKDYVVDKQVIRSFYEQVRSPIKRWAYYPDSYHAIFHELNKEQVFADCIDFTNQVFAEPLQTVDLTEAHSPKTHAQSFSKDRVDSLAVKGFNPSFAITKLAMQKFGHISDGIATGLKHGFDSGSSLQKVYDYAPKGSNPIGKAIDKFYLNNIGWQGIRIRKGHLLELASLAINNRVNRVQAKSGADSDIHIMDIASGNGQYLFELLAHQPNLHAEMRDYDSHNIDVMQTKASELKLTERVKAVQKDAFDKASYDTKKILDVAIASGVFELFSDNEQISTAIKGIYKQLKKGGYFIYTNQPWHPEQEFIGKTLNSHQGKDWVMRCRSQAEMDQLVTKAGFEKVTMRIDKFGIFTVSLAIKPVS